MEAHALDEWPLGVVRSTTAQHRCIEDRCAAARRFRSKLTAGGVSGEPADIAAAATVPWAVDSMANRFYRAFGAWPEGHIVIGADGTLQLCTESQDGEGTVAGGEWHGQVERVLSGECGVTPDDGEPLSGNPFHSVHP